jgi:pyruvate/2-oxoglutarate dehydrogenase complex dihydrolipoamide dehydrogenase (E3) component
LLIGGGPIGCELGQSFNRLGCQVTLVDMAERVMMPEDEQAAALLQAQLTSEGVNLKLGYTIEAFHKEGSEQGVSIKSKAGAIEQIGFDAVLFAIGRAANTQGFGLEELGVKTTRSGTIEVDKYMCSSVPTIYACGDVAGPYQFTHTAAHHAWYSAVNSLFGDIWRFKADNRVIPRVTFTEPEIASVGLNEESAKASGLAVEVTNFKLDELDRAIVDGKTEGFIKVLTPIGKDKILGVTIVGEHAGEMLPEFVLAMKHGLGLNKILGTIHAYPTWAEANKYTACVWKKNNKPEGVLRLLEKYHRAKRSKN